MGLSHIDKDILENVEILAEVTDTLVSWLKLAAETANSDQMSEREVGETALFALIGIENGIGAWIDENKLS